MKKIIAIILTVCLLSALSIAANAKIATEYYSDDLLSPTEAAAENVPVGTKLEINAASCILLEPTTGKILYEDNADEKLAPASITKIMSLILIMEAIDKGYFNLDTKITASEYACSMGGSQIWLEPNESMTVDELLRATVIASANDATVALAEAVAGSEEEFVAKMNEKAKELNMTNTTFKNATGLDADGHLTTARDIAIMSSELIKHDLIKKYSTVWMDSLRGGESELVNTNKLVRYYEGCTGLKTGTTSIAGSCLSATAERNGLKLVAVIMKGASSKDRFNGARKLLDYGFANYTYKTVAADESLLNDVKVSGGMQKSIKIKALKAASVLLQKSQSKDITQTPEIPDSVSAPVKENDKIGAIHLFIDGNEIGTIDILAAETVLKPDFFSSLLAILSQLLSV